MGPLLTLAVIERWRAARAAGETSIACSLDLQRSTTRVELLDGAWAWQGARYPYLEGCKARTIYHWTGAAFEVASRYSGSLIKLVPTEWGPPTFEIDGIKMLPTARVSPYADAERKVALIRPSGKRILDTCGGLGYFAACCLAGRAARVLSFEKNPDVIWLRSLNPWSPTPDAVLQLTEADAVSQIATLAPESFDAILHDPPRFGIAGELYSGAFYTQLARVLKRGGRLFHYTGSPNKLTSGRDVAMEVSKRLSQSGFVTELNGDGVLAVLKSPRRP
jgi:predicted methyltransferase